MRPWPSSLVLTLLGLPACTAPSSEPSTGPIAELRYTGSSTVATFVREAEPVYGRARFTIDTHPESAGGERAILERATDVAGVADRPSPEVLRTGIAATLIGRDAIAVIVHADNPLGALTSSDLRRIFTGRVERWSELGGANLPVEVLITGEESATHRVFREAILPTEDYAGGRVVRPDWEIVAAVGEDPGAIGQISFSFLENARGVRALAVDGERPSVTNFAYAIARPLYLLHWEGDPAVDAFVAWATSEAGQRVVMRHFVGTRVVGSVESTPPTAAKGTLVVYTETFPAYDGGIYYYPHRSYALLTPDGEPLRRVRNHRGQNDEAPTRVALAPGTYLIRPETADGSEASFFVTIESARVTTVDVAELLGSGR